MSGGDAHAYGVETRLPVQAQIRRVVKEVPLKIFAKNPLCGAS
jgi:hypothetical protein